MPTEALSAQEASFGGFHQPLQFSNNYGEFYSKVAVYNNYR